MGEAWERRFIQPVSSKVATLTTVTTTRLSYYYTRLWNIMATGAGLFDVCYDIQQEILQHLSSADLATLATSSWRAHELAVPFLASNVCLRGNDWASLSKKIVSFCYFMLLNQDPVNRCTYLRVLKLLGRLGLHSQKRGSECTPPIAMTMLAVMLKQAVNIRTLEIDSMGVLLKAEPRLVRVLSSSCQRLATVVFGDADDVTLNILQQFPKLISVTLDARGNRPGGASLGPILKATNEGLSPRNLTECCWPEVKYLTLYDVSASAACLARAFPNLRQLALYQRVSFDILSDHTTDTKHQWKNLRAVCSDVLSMRKARLLFPIDHLLLAPVPCRRSSFPIDMEEQLTLHTLRISLPSALYMILRAEAPKSFLVQAAAALTRLSRLIVCVFPEQCIVGEATGQAGRSFLSREDVVAVIHRFSDGLKDLRAQRLDLRVKTEFKQPEDDNYPRKLVTEVAKIPALRFFTFTVKDQEGKEHCWYYVFRNVDGRHHTVRVVSSNLVKQWFFNGCT
ncbi:hypothetical protein NEOLEDRAFT_1241984 [Neolentinus lepideus HHB14362 ss-1]|uniref:F-box domain-containing protein n=1 Tax=Neolentinus lepideus HHB14362 ss-1 TaxID=1314782 RepID=A0A165SIY1_9AGAM|nr:hypothetical protein NEOLEDRAFT_1241984 [Neolentinus lepideus HHB14362 ss-1]